MGYESSGGLVAAVTRISVEVQIVMAYPRPSFPQTVQRLHHQCLVAVLNEAGTPGSFRLELIQGSGANDHEPNSFRLELIQGYGVNDHELLIVAMTTRWLSFLLLVLLQWTPPTHPSLMRLRD